MKRFTSILFVLFFASTSYAAPKKEKFEKAKWVICQSEPGKLPMTFTIGKSPMLNQGNVRVVTILTSTTRSTTFITLNNNIILRCQFNSRRLIKKKGEECMPKTAPLVTYTFTPRRYVRAFAWLDRHGRCK
jgi:hypothetical protein